MRASALRHARFSVSPQLAVLSSVVVPITAGQVKLPCTSTVILIRFTRTAVVAPPTPFCTRISFNRSREEALNGQPVPQLRGV